MVETDSSSVAKRTRNKINCNGRSLHPVGTWVEHQKGLVGEKKNSVMIPECVESVPMEVHSKFGLGTAATHIGAKKKVPRHIISFLDLMRVMDTTAGDMHAASHGGTTAVRSRATRFLPRHPCFTDIRISGVTVSRDVFRRCVEKICSHTLPCCAHVSRLDFVMRTCVALFHKCCDMFLLCCHLISSSCPTCPRFLCDYFPPPGAVHSAMSHHSSSVLRSRNSSQYPCMVHAVLCHCQRNDRLAHADWLQTLAARYFAAHRADKEDSSPTRRTRTLPQCIWLGHFHLWLLEKCTAEASAT